MSQPGTQREFQNHREGQTEPAHLRQRAFPAACLYEALLTISPNTTHPGLASTPQRALEYPPY